MASLLDQLNPQQRQAAEILEGPVLIFAGAGSGKTRTLTYRIAHMVREKGISPESILAVTFTNKAANELKERIQKLIGAQTKGLWAGTFHSICARILRAEGEAIGVPPNFSIYDEGDQQSIVKEALSVMDGDSEDKYSPVEILSRISRAKNELLDVQGYRRARKGAVDEMAQRVYAFYEERLRTNCALDFDDLLMKAVELLQTKPSVLRRLQDRFDYVLVDEYQDINHAQYRLVQLLGGKHNNICVVGDDDQSIYGWRGANVGIILAFENDYPRARVVKLEQNYRSTQKILECAYEVIRANKGRADKRLWTENQPGDNIVVYRAVNEEEEATWVASVIRNQVSCRTARPGDYAILYRANAMSRVFEDRLLQEGLPYDLVGGLKFYDRGIIKDALAYLRAIHNPADGLSLRRIINKPARGLGDKSLSELDRLAHRENITLLEACGRAAELEDLSRRAVAAATEFYHNMVKLQEVAEAWPLPRLVKAVLERSGYLALLEASDKEEDETRLDDLGEFVNVATRFAERHPDATLSTFLEHIALISDLDKTEDLGSRVSLLTVHSSKGLEFPIVFLVGLEEGLFPHERSMGDEFQIEEERRLCYVGITRAERKLYLTHSASRMVFGQRRRPQASRFLKDLPEHVLERRGDVEPCHLPAGPSERSEAALQALKEQGIDIADLVSRARENQKLTQERLAAEASEQTPAAVPEPPVRRRRREARETGGPAPEARSAAVAVKTGARVSHRKFGQGIVVSVEEGEAGEEAAATVAFPQKGIKKLLVSHLEVLS